MDSNSRSARTSLHRSMATFVVMCTVIALWSGPAYGAPDRGTSELGRYEQVAKPQQQQRPTSRVKSKSARLRQFKKIVARQSVTSPAARQTSGTISSGFDPRINGFSFPNWLDDPNNTAIGIETLIRVFGQTSVCAQVIAGTCDPYRSATDFVAKLRVALANGRCDGLVVLASRLFQQQSSLNNFSPNATTVAELTVSQVDAEVVYWWTTQVLPTFSKASAETRTLLPSQLESTDPLLKLISTPPTPSRDLPDYVCNFWYFSANALRAAAIRFPVALVVIPNMVAASSIVQPSHSTSNRTSRSCTRI